MRPTRLFPFAILLLVALGCLVPPAAGQSRERIAYVSALDKKGEPLESLAPTDVVVKEDNRTREVLSVAPADEPMQIAVLVDNAQHARTNITDIRTALREFVTAMTAPHEAGWRNELAIITMADRPTIAADYTTDRAQLLKAADRIFATPGSGAYLLDTLIEVSKGFKKRDAARPVIVAITVEGTDYSTAHHDQALGPLKDNHIAFHALPIGSPATPNTDELRYRAIVLDRGPVESGGRHATLLTSMALKAELASLANELTHQFKITYVRPQSLLPPEKVVISSARADITLRGTPGKDQAQK